MIEPIPNPVTVAAVVAGELGLSDLRLTPSALRKQADAARRDGNPQLAANLERGAELTLISDDEILGLYNALRPHRSTASELAELARSMRQRGAPQCAELIERAAASYARRGLLR